MYEVALSGHHLPAEVLSPGWPPHLTALAIAWDARSVTDVQAAAYLCVDDEM